MDTWLKQESAIWTNHLASAIAKVEEWIVILMLDLLPVSIWKTRRLKSHAEKLRAFAAIHISKV